MLNIRQLSCFRSGDAASHLSSFFHNFVKLSSLSTYLPLLYARVSRIKSSTVPSEYTTLSLIGDTAEPAP